MIKVIVISLSLGMSMQALAYQHPEQSRCDYLSENIKGLHTINSPRPAFKEQLNSYLIEFELRGCPVVASYLFAGVGHVERTGFEKPDPVKPTLENTKSVRKKP